MIDHYSWMRSDNYFKVKDPEAFKAFVAKYNLTWHTDNCCDQEGDCILVHEVKRTHLTA